MHGITVRPSVQGSRFTTRLRSGVFSQMLSARYSEDFRKKLQTNRRLWSKKS